MNKKLKIGIPVIAGVLALSTGIGVVAAKGADPTPAVQPPSSYQPDVTNQDETTYSWYCGGFGGMMGYGAGFQVTQQVADLLGTTPAELQSRLNAGETLADIAGAAGVGQDQLTETMLAPFSDHLDIMLKYGYLTQAQADTLTQQARERIQTIINNGFSYDGDEDGDWGWMGGMMNGYGGPQGQSGTGAAPRSGYGYGGMMGGGFGGGMMGW